MPSVSDLLMVRIAAALPPVHKNHWDVVAWLIDNDFKFECAKKIMVDGYRCRYNYGWCIAWKAIDDLMKKLDKASA